MALIHSKHKVAQQTAAVYEKVLSERGRFQGQINVTCCYHIPPRAPNIEDQVVKVSECSCDLALKALSAPDVVAEQRMWEKAWRRSGKGGSFDLELRKIARERFGISGRFSVTRDIFEVSQITGVQSLRARLRELV